MDRSDPCFSARLSREGRSPFSGALLRAVGDLVLETTTEGIWLVDDAERTTFVNEHTAQLMGYSVDEMLGQHIFRFMDDEGRALCERSLERRKKGEQELLEFRLVRKDGSHVWVLVATNPVYDRAGRYAGALAMIADLSQQKSRELCLTTELDSLRARFTAQERELTELREHSALWEKASVNDWLTGLYNRRHFEHCLATEIGRYERRIGRFCVLLLDLDGFAKIDHDFGRELSDGILKSVARALERHPETGEIFLRSTDIPARYGANCFAILAVDTNLEGGTKLAERLLKRIAGIQVATASGQALRIAASIGVAAFPAQARALEPLMEAAERALRQAKQNGGARCCVAEIAPRS